MLTPKFLFCGPQCAESVELSVVAVGGVNGEIAMSRREMTVGCCSATVGAPPYSFLRCCFNWLGRSGSSKMHNATRVDWRRRRRRSNFGDFGRRKWGPWQSSWLMPFEMPLVHPLRRLPFNFCDNPSRIGRSRVDWTRRRRRSSFGELWAPRRGTWRSWGGKMKGKLGINSMINQSRKTIWNQDDKWQTEQKISPQTTRVWSKPAPAQAIPSRFIHINPINSWSGRRSKTSKIR